MASTGATHRHLQLLVLLLICASTSTTAAPIKLPFDLPPDDSEWHSLLSGTPAGKEAAILFCKEAVEAYNRENPKGRLNGCRSVYSAKAKRRHSQSLLLRLQLESSQRSWLWEHVYVAADLVAAISFYGPFDSRVDWVFMVRVLRDYGL